MRKLYRSNRRLHLPLLLIILTIAASLPARGETLTQTELDLANTSLTESPPFSAEDGGFSSETTSESQETAKSVNIDSPSDNVNENKLVNEGSDNDEPERVEEPDDQANNDGRNNDESLSDEEAELLILKVTSKGYIMSHALAAYDFGDNIYLSLFDLADALFFPIEVFDEEQRAEGWFIKPENDFYLNAQAGELIIAGERRDIAQDDIFVNDDGMFISAKAMKKWFGIESTLNYAEQKLDLIADGKLNFEAIVEREKRWEEKQNQRVRVRKTYPPVENPYALAEFPDLTIQLSSNYADSGGETVLSGNYSVQGVSDLLYASSDYFITGNDDTPISDARIRFFRFDEDGGAIPAIGATRFEIGDISPPSLNIIGGGGNERGVYVSNRDLGTISAPDNFLIDGEVEPGYEVELYRNTEFIAFLDSTQTQDGRFEFTNLSLDGGNNVFKIVKYGPHGEEEVEFRRFLIGDGVLKTGQWNYDLSLSQPNQQVIPIPEQDFDLTTSPRVIANVEYGLSETLSFGAGLYSGPLFDESTHHGVTLSARNSLFGVYNRLDHLQNIDSSSVTTFSQRTSIEDVTISNFIAYYNGFDEEEQDLEFTASTSVGTGVDVFGTGVAVRFGGAYESFQTDRTITTFSNQISSSLFGFSFSNQLEWRIDETGGSSSETIDGDLFFRERFRDIFTDSQYGILVRANLDYQIKPETELSNLNITAEKSLTDRIRSEIGYSQSLGEDKTWSATSRLSYDNGFFVTDLSGQYNNEGDYTLGLGLRFNVGYDSEEEKYGVIGLGDAGRGTATAFVYHDVNYNHQFDAGDIPLEDVQFKSDDGNNGLSNENGLATIKRQTGFRKTNLVLQNQTLPDIFMVPVREGIQYIPRPGHLSHFEFPVVLGGEVDGEILATDAKLGRDHDFSEITIELVGTDGDIVKSTQADPTGYFLFEQVIPADYHLRVAPDSLGEAKLINEQDIIISVPKEDPVVSGIEIDVMLPLAIYDEAFGPYQPGKEPKPSKTAAPKQETKAKATTSEQLEAPEASEVPETPETLETNEPSKPEKTIDQIVEEKAEPEESQPVRAALPNADQQEHPEVKTLENGDEYLTIPQKRYKQNIAAPVVPIDIGIGGPTPEESLDSFPSSIGDPGTKAETQTYILPWLLE